MKKILFLFLLSFSFCTKVNADYDCSYEGKTNEKISQGIHIKFTVKKDTIAPILSDLLSFVYSNICCLDDQSISSEYTPPFFTFSI